MPHHVDAPPPRPAGQLGELPGGEQLVAFAGELVEALDDHGPGGHVDAERERFGGECQPYQTGLEQLLDRLLEHRDQPGVVGGDAVAQSLQPLFVAQDVQVVAVQVGASCLGELPDLLALPGVGEATPSRRHWETAASQPLREKMKYRAGSMPEPSSNSAMSARRGNLRRCPWCRYGGGFRPRG